MAWMRTSCAALALAVASDSARWFTAAEPMSPKASAATIERAETTRRRPGVPASASRTATRAPATRPVRRAAPAAPGRPDAGGPEAGPTVAGGTPDGRVGPPRLGRAPGGWGMTHLPSEPAGVGRARARPGPPDSDYPNEPEPDSRGPAGRAPVAGRTRSDRSRCHADPCGGSRCTSDVFALFALFALFAVGDIID